MVISTKVMVDDSTKIIIVKILRINSIEVISNFVRRIVDGHHNIISFVAKASSSFKFHIQARSNYMDSTIMVISFNLIAFNFDFHRDSLVVVII